MATRVLHRVATQDAWATPALDAEIQRAELSVRDAALATEIVYGTLRGIPAIDAEIAAHLKRSTKRMDPWAHAALRAAVYQIRHLERVPAHAAVDDAVALVRRNRDPRLGGFVNAVLRKVTARRPQTPAPPHALQLPPWLERELLDSLGQARAEAFVGTRPLPPPLGLRVHGDRERMADAIRRARPQARVELGELSPEALLVWHAGDPRTLPGYEQGDFTVQEQGSQRVAGWLQTGPGERVADACAGRGGKTVQLASAVGDTGHVLAIDVHEPKLEQIGAELERLGIDPGRVSTEALDLTVGTGGFEGSFDRVLVDAPCSNLGTIHRRPELLLRTSHADVQRMGELQTNILRGAIRLLRPGGVLLYAVCSPMQREGAAVVHALESEQPGLRRLPFDDSKPAADEDGMVRLGPWLGESDVYQVARWRWQPEPE